MARSKIFEALLEEAGKQAQKGGEALKGTTPIGVKKEVVPQTVNQTVSKTVRQSNERPNGQSDRHSDSQIDTQIDSQIDRHSNRQSKEQSYRQSARHTFEDQFHWMSKNQIAIFSFLIDNKSRVTTLETISNCTGVPYGTVRGVIRKLVQKKCLSPPQRYRDGATQGFSYNVDEGVCQQFKEHKYYRQSIRQSDEQSEKQSNRQSDEQTVCQTDKQTVCLYSSSSFIKKPTTWLDDELAQNPELGYWRQKGLTSKQIQNWIDTTGCDPELIIQYLCYCRYEMVDLGLEETKPVNNVFNWFFKIIEKNCSYPKPKGYKTFQERQIEEKTRLLEKRKADAAKIKKVAQELAEAEIEVDFWEVMADPDSDLYKKCFDNLSNFEKKRGRKSGKAFEDAMLRAYKKLYC
jgi:predicted transcriptional regulator